jgi:hypothetical protein
MKILAKFLKEARIFYSKEYPGIPLGNLRESERNRNRDSLCFI